MGNNGTSASKFLRWCSNLFYFIFQLQLIFNIMLYSFHVYNIVVEHLYKLQSDPPNNSSTPLARYIFYWLYSLCCTLHPLDYSGTANLYFSILLPFSGRPPNLLPSGNHQFLLCICESASASSLHLFCSLDSTCKWNCMVSVFPCLSLLSIIPPRSIHVIRNGKVLFFLWLNNIPLYICTTTFVFTHLLMGTWVASTSRLL